jgi:hypothetical protein
MAKCTDQGQQFPNRNLHVIVTIRRVRDWIHGVRAAAPPKETREALESEPLYEAERLRIIYQLITNPTDEGGAGITPKEGEWKGVESVFALHDHAYNKDWIKKWTSSYFLKTEDLDDIRNRLGEKACTLPCCIGCQADCHRLPSTLPSRNHTSHSSCFLPLLASYLGSFSVTSRPYMAL